MSPLFIGIFSLMRSGEWLSCIYCGGNGFYTPLPSSFSYFVLSLLSSLCDVFNFMYLTQLILVLEIQGVSSEIILATHLNRIREPHPHIYVYKTLANIIYTLINCIKLHTCGIFYYVQLTEVIPRLPKKKVLKEVFKFAERQCLNLYKQFCCARMTLIMCTPSPSGTIITTLKVSLCTDYDICMLHVY